jgi:hypothetical protein
MPVSFPLPIQLASGLFQVRSGDDVVATENRIGFMPDHIPRRGAGNRGVFYDISGRGSSTGARLSRSSVAMNEQDRRISEIVAEELARLRNFIRRRVPDPADAEDIVQVFYELVEANPLLMRSST